MLVLSLVLRPALMLFGLILSIGVAQPIATLINATFMFAIKGAMHGTANGIGATVAFVMIYAVVMTVLLHAVFALINYIPDKALRWMGSHVGMDGVADREAQESQHVFVMGAGQGSHLMHRGGGAAGSAAHAAGGAAGGAARGRGNGGDDKKKGSEEGDHSQLGPS